jgi:hypothetical protein
MIPKRMSRITPSPDLFTILLPINPAIKPKTIQARIDIRVSLHKTQQFLPATASPFQFQIVRSEVFPLSNSGIFVSKAAFKLVANTSPRQCIRGIFFSSISYGRAVAQLCGRVGISSKAQKWSESGRNKMFHASFPAPVHTSKQPATPVARNTSKLSTNRTKQQA